MKEQQEVNTQLRDYIDGILTNIIMQHPELLEVKKWKECKKKTFLLPVDVILKAKLCKDFFLYKIEIILEVLHILAL